ncbi:hybrid sensor histidine kinase/response regulator [Rhodobacteraceae bacterium F11138]|nr:hybrid sensor histidine kinase/response regulator [Rhodobacteraceae bacterium F11138]
MVFLTLVCMSLGAITIGFVAIFGIQSFRQEFDRMIEADLPQATVATRLNAEVSGLTSLVGLLLTARSEIALSTIRIQTGDQLDAINRQSALLQDFELRSGEYAEIESSLTELVHNLGALTLLSVRRLRAEDAFRALINEALAQAASHENGLTFLLWLQNVEATTRIQEIPRMSRDLEKIAQGIAWMTFGQRILDQRMALLEIETNAQGRLNRHTQMSERLADATRFMSSRLITEANTRSAAIQSLIQRNLYFILACFFTFATVGAFIYHYLDKHVVGPIQDLTRRMNDYGGASRPQVSSTNEITQLETSFAKLTDAIAERENRLVTLNSEATDARRDAEKANRSKSKLLAAASHDLRQPIHAMGLLIGGIARDELSEASRQTVEHLTNLTQETVQLFNSVLDLSKLEAGTFTATLTPMDLGALFSRLENEFQPRSSRSGAVLDIMPPIAGTFVNADEDAVYRILSNLIVNAIDYGNDGHVQVGVCTDANLCTVFVADNGPGLMLEQATATDRAKEDEVASYGLGLSISFALAKAMKTELTFSTPEGDGTRFELPLELATHSSGAGQVKAARHHGFEPLFGLPIVLVEDNPDVNISTRDGLVGLGCTVSTCRTYQEAQQAISTLNKPFVLISDIDLGRGRRANEFIFEIKASTPHLIATVVTTASVGDFPKLWQGDPKVHVMEKPFKLGRLASLLRHLAP